MANKDDEVKLKITLDGKKTAGFKEVEKAPKQLTKDGKKAESSMKGLSASLLKVGGSLLAVGTAKKAFDMVKEINANKDSMLNLSNATGITVKELSALQYSAELNKTSFESVQASIKKMAMTLGQAEMGSKNSQKAFSDLGVETKDLDGKTKDVTALFYESIDALSAVENETDRLTRAQLIFGRGAAELGSIIKGGSEALRESNKEAESLGVTFDRLSAEKAANFNDSMLRIESSANALSMTFAEKLTPEITNLMEAWNLILSGKNTDKFIEAQSEFGVRWAKANGSLKQTIALQEKLNSIAQSESGSGGFLGDSITSSQAGIKLDQYEDIEDQERKILDSLREEA